MRHLLLFLASFITFSSITAQDNSRDSTVSTSAVVKVNVTDMKGKPSKGEQVIFTGTTTTFSLGGITDAKGKFSITLPQGDKYLIIVKSINDSTRHGLIEIPRLGEDEFFTDPFTVDVKFEAAKKYTLDNVHFDFGKATLRPSSTTELNELADYLRNKESINIEIAGHTDNIGKDGDNLRLSQQRADAIKAWLIKNGIAAKRLTSVGYGASQPVADNGTEEGRQLNRRTEVRVHK